MGFGNATDAQIAATTSVKQGQTLVNRGQDDWIFASGILTPEQSNILSYQYSHYLGTSILERLGKYEGIAQSDWSWNEMERTRKSCEVTSANAGSGNFQTVTTDIPSDAAGSDGYYIVGDQLITESGVTLIVSAVNAAGGFQTITISKADGSIFVAGDFSENERFGHLGNAFGEYSDAPKGRLNLPVTKRNLLQKMRRSVHISGDALTSRVYPTGGSSWAYEQEMIEMEEFARDRENVIMFGEQSAPNAPIYTTEGIVRSIAFGTDSVKTTFGASVTEKDIQDHILALRVSGGVKEMLVYGGAQFMGDATRELKEYSLNGAMDYGTFNGKNIVGLGLHAYKFMDVTVYFVHYPAFDDQETLPYTGGANATKINYSNFSLWLNLGKDKGHDLISLKYKQLAGEEQRKFLYKTEDGMMGEGAKVANGKDGISTHMLSEIGAEVRCLNKHGVLYAAS